MRRAHSPGSFPDEEGGCVVQGLYVGGTLASGNGDGLLLAQRRACEQDRNNKVTSKGALDKGLFDFLRRRIFPPVSRRRPRVRLRRQHPVQYP